MASSAVVGRTQRGVRFVAGLVRNGRFDRFGRWPLRVAGREDDHSRSSVKCLEENIPAVRAEGRTVMTLRYVLAVRAIG